MNRLIFFKQVHFQDFVILLSFLSSCKKQLLRKYAEPMHCSSLWARGTSSIEEDNIAEKQMSALWERKAVTCVHRMGNYKHKNYSEGTQVHVRSVCNVGEFGVWIIRFRGWISEHSWFYFITVFLIRLLSPKFPPLNESGILPEEGLIKVIVK